jgi:spoIIIJ-associated protein
VSTAPQTPSESGGQDIHIEAESFNAAIADAASRLGVAVAALGIEVLDPGRSASAAGGYRPVKIRAWKRAASEPPDGARPSGGRGEGPSYRGGRGEGPSYRGSRRPFERGEAPSYGPPPPPMDPEKITPAHVEETRALCEGLVRSMGFDARAEGAKTKHGIRVGIEAGESDQYLIGPDGETLGAIQYLVARMLRARLREDSMPRIEVDVAGYRDRRNEELREMARGLMDEVRRTGEEALTDPLTAAERRIVHLEVAETPGMMTVTLGEGEYKRVLIRQGEPEGGAR